MISFFNLSPKIFRKLHKLFNFFVIFSLILQLGSGVFLYRPVLAEGESPTPEPTTVVEQVSTPTPEPAPEPSTEPTPEPSPTPTIEVSPIPSSTPEQPTAPVLSVEQGSQELIVPQDNSGLDLNPSGTGGASAQLNPSISTDKGDYAPEETVKITGENFPTNTTLLIKVTRPDGSVVKGDGSFQPGSDEITTDAEGKFEYFYQLDGIEGEYKVEVFQGETVLATTIFTDQPPPVSWPTTWITPAQCSTDPAGETGVSPTNVDLVGDGSNPAIGFQVDGTYRFFRERLNGDPSKKPSGFVQQAWVVLFQTSPPKYQYLGSLNGKDDKVQLYANSVVGADVDFQPLFNDPAEPPPLWEGNTSIYARIVDAGGGFYYVDWAIPLSAFSGTGIGDNTTKFFATSSDANNYNKDHLNCYEAIADLSINKTDNPDPVNSGGTLTYALAIHNSGPDTASGVVVTDTLPAGYLVTSVTPSQGSCSDTTEPSIQCELGTINNGGDVTVTIVGTITGSGTVTNNTSISLDTTVSIDTNTANNSDSEDTIINPAVVCGDGIVNQTSEQCDGGAQNGQVCTPSYGDTCNYCSNSCQIETVTGPYCGDGYVDEQYEACEDAQQQACMVGNYNGTQACVAESCQWGTCEPTERCGDGKKNGTEECDGTDGVNPGQNFCTVTCHLVPIYDGQHTCPEGMVRSQNPIMPSIQISATDPDGENINLALGMKLLLEVSGTFIPTSAPGYLADAGYTTIDGVLSPLYGIHGIPPDYAAHALLSDFGDTDNIGVIDWGNYNPDHVYTKYYETNQTNWTRFLIGDRYGDWFNTPYQNQTGMTDNQGSLTLNIYECQLPPVTIKGYKVVCDSEADLPNWGNHGSSIGATTAQDYVANSQGHCQLVNDWKFQYGPAGAGSFGSFQIETDEKGTPWQTFNVNSDAVINDLSNLSGRIETREVFPNNDYIGFSNGGNVSAEFYCTGDVYNYDNWEWINNPQYGQTYYCVAFNAPQAETISGRKWEDKNGNGYENAGDNVLSGWTINLWNGASVVDPSLPADQTTVTAGDGSYSFENLLWGDYTVCEEDRAGWEQTFPGGGTCYYLTVRGNIKPADNIDFGNFKLGKIQSRKYEDLNNDSTRDSGEPYRNGWTIRLYKQGEVWQLVDTKVTGHTGTLGQYRFENLGLGTYYLCEVLQPGWTQTDPRAPEGFDNQSGAGDEASRCRRFVMDQSGAESIGEKHFGNIHFGSISGMKFEDINGDGTNDGEPGLNKWEIFLDKNDNGVLDGAEISLITDDNGYYRFENLLPGGYSVCEVEQAGWFRTKPSDSNCQPVTVNSGEDIRDIDFGNFQLGEITACKYDDYDGDGGKDEGEPGIANVTMTLERWVCPALAVADGICQWLPVTSGDTGGDGCYTFAGLGPGHYRASEDLNDLPGYNPTSPSLVETDISTSGQLVAVDFFNKLQKITLSLDKTHDKVGITASAGDTFNFALTVENTASSTAYGVTVRDVLPDGFSYVLGTAKVDGVPSEPTISGQQLIWGLGDMTAGQIKTITYQVTTDSSLPAGDYPNVSVAKGTNRSTGSPDNTTSYSNFAFIYTALGGGISYTTSVGGPAVLGAATQVLGAATGSPTGLLILALLIILAGITVFNLETIKKRLTKFNYKKLFKGFFVALAFLVISAGVAKANGSLVVKIGNLPEYINYDPFKIYYTALQVEDKPIEVKGFMNKDGQAKFEFGSSTQTSGSFNVDGSLLTGDGKYYFLVKATSDGVTVESDEESVIIDRQAPGPVSNYSKQKIGSQKYKICWKNPDEDDFKEVLIYRSDKTEFDANYSTQIAAVGGSKNDEKCFENDVPEDKDYYYVTRVIDKAGNISGVVGDSETNVKVLGVTVSPSPAPIVLPVVSPAPTGEIEEGQILGGETVEETPAPGVLGGLGQTAAEAVSGLGIWKTLGLVLLGGGIIGLIIFLLKRR